MYVVEGKFAFLATPRTGSRSVAEALMQRGAKAVSAHHVEFKYLKKVRQMNPGLKIYAFAREPLAQLRSWLNLLYNKAANPGLVDTGLRRQLLHGLKDPVDYANHDLFRNPYEAVFRHLFLDGEDQFRHQHEQTGYRLNAYANYCDKLFVYEDGLDAFFDYVGLGVELPHIGQARHCLSGTLSPATLDDTRRKFAADFALYRSL